MGLLFSRKEYENVVMDCCQLEDHLVHRSVKREDIGDGNDPENGSPGTDTGGKKIIFLLHWLKKTLIPIMLENVYGCRMCMYVRYTFRLGERLLPSLLRKAFNPLFPSDNFLRIFCSYVFFPL